MVIISHLFLAFLLHDSGDTVSGAIGASSISGTDHVTYTYYCNGARATATDQRGVVHTYSYDYGVVGQGVEAKHLRQSSVTYPGPSNPNRWAVYYNYPTSGIGAPWHGHPAWGPQGLARESQGRPGPAVAGEAHGRDPDVYRDGTHGQDAHGTHGQDAHATLGGRTKFAGYTYLGAGTVVKVAYPAVTVSSNPLALTYWTSGGGYAGFDRLGRVIGGKRGQEPFLVNRLWSNNGRNRFLTPFLLRKQPLETTNST